MTNHPGGKGSASRPMEITREEYGNRHEAIFGKKRIQQPTVLTEPVINYAIPLEQNTQSHPLAAAIETVMIESLAKPKVEQKFHNDTKCATLPLNEMGNHETITPKNMEAYASNIFVVRTEAGFRKALKAYSAYLGKEEGKYDIEGFPSTYPCLIIFNVGHKGYTYVKVDCVHLNTLKDIVQKDELHTLINSTNALLEMHAKDSFENVSSSLEQFRKTK